jgi:hypothetical protein
VPINADAEQAIDQGKKLVRHLYDTHLEAAKAGDAFAARRVTPDEVRGLAERAGLSPAAARTMGDMINTHNAAVRKAQGDIYAAVEAQITIVRSVLGAAMTAE